MVWNRVKFDIISATNAYGLPAEVTTDKAKI
jgi:hypothetical protein